MHVPSSPLRLAIKLVFTRLWTSWAVDTAATVKIITNSCTLECLESPPLLGHGDEGRPMVLKQGFRRSKLDKKGPGIPEAS